MRPQQPMEVPLSYRHKCFVLMLTCTCGAIGLMRAAQPRVRPQTRPPQGSCSLHEVPLVMTALNTPSLLWPDLAAGAIGVSCPLALSFLRASRHQRDCK